MRVFSKKASVISVILLASALIVPRAFSHCQIPCGIYDDETRFRIIAEHITTIGKSMKTIMQLMEEDTVNANQVVRWVQNKEKHADELSHIVTYYFMTQRVAPVDEKDAMGFREYTKKLTLLHQMLYYAMKAKQTTDLSNVEKLTALLEDFRSAYFGPEAEGQGHRR